MKCLSFVVDVEMAFWWDVFGHLFATWLIAIAPLLMPYAFAIWEDFVDDSLRGHCWYNFGTLLMIFWEDIVDNVLRGHCWWYFERTLLMMFWGDIVDVTLRLLMPLWDSVNATCSLRDIVLWDSIDATCSLRDIAHWDSVDATYWLKILVHWDSDDATWLIEEYWDSIDATWLIEEYCSLGNFFDATCSCFIDWSYMVHVDGWFLMRKWTICYIFDPTYLMVHDWWRVYDVCLMLSFLLLLEPLLMVQSRRVRRTLHLMELKRCTLHLFWEHKLGIGTHLHFWFESELSLCFIVYDSTWIIGRDCLCWHIDWRPC